jgi:hypothetical protein
MAREIKWIQEQIKIAKESGWENQRKISIENRNYCDNWDEKSWGGTDEFKNVFIHIPKCAGYSIMSCMGRYSRMCDYHFASHVREKANHKYSFFYSVTRNPFDRFVSSYEFIFSPVGGDFKKYFIEFGEDLSSRKTFTFERYVDVVTKELWHVMWEPQVSFLYDDNDNCLVNYVGDQKNLQESINIVLSKIGISDIVDVPFSNKSDRLKPNFKDYYNDDTRKKIEKYYEKDIDYLKRGFNDE